MLTSLNERCLYVHSWGYRAETSLMHVVVWEGETDWINLAGLAR